MKSCMKFLLVPLSFFLLIGCDGFGKFALKDYMDSEQVIPVAAGQSWYPEQENDEFYLTKVKPIFEKRCVTCHGCYEAPCQLNMQSYQGVRRGYHGIPVYNMDRKNNMAFTQMNNAFPLSQWRNLGFHPVVSHNEEDSVNQNWEKSLLKIFVENGYKYNQPGFPLTDKVKKIYKKSRRNEDVCTATPEQYSKHFSSEKKNPWDVLDVNKYFEKTTVNGNASGAGMPFALPALSADEVSVLTEWMSKGAKGPSKISMESFQISSNPTVIQQWEKFFNTDSPKGRHTARYVYEHTYTALYHFDEIPGEYYQLVRLARLKDGSFGEVITKFPYQLPSSVQKVIYKLKKVTETIVQKKMNVWHINNQKLNRLKELFVKNWNMDIVAEPVYVNSNPFEYFSPIPAESRSRFMIENSKIIIGAMVQGAVCVGSGATYAIRDHFWIWFLKPESDVSVITPRLGLSSWDQMGTGRWEKEEERNYEELGHLWRKIQGIDYNIDAAANAVKYFDRTIKDYKSYNKAYEKQLRLLLQKQNRIGLDENDIWTGKDNSTSVNNVNPNAWLNVTRHENNTSVQYGAEGGRPGSMWVLSYSNFERLYYNLVANYDPFGDLAMKMSSFRIMTFVRLEAEDLAISFLPKETREDIRKEYTRGMGWLVFNQLTKIWSLQGMDGLPPRDAGSSRIADIYNDLKVQHSGANLSLRTANQMIDIGQEKLKLVLEKVYNEQGSEELQKGWEKQFIRDIADKSEQTDGVKYARFFPSTSYVRILNENKEPRLYTIINDHAYKSNVVISTEKYTREPEANKVTLYRGLVGAYPNVFFDIKEGQEQQFIDDVKAVLNEEDWVKLQNKYGVSRTSSNFWTYFDWLHEFKKKNSPGVNSIDQGVVDLEHYNFF